jgi:hypothetical protein
MYVLRRVHRWEMPADPNDGAVAKAFNINHAAECIKVEWGIGGLKTRLRRLLTNCPTWRGLFSSMFTACRILTNFIHRNKMEFSIVSTDESPGDSGSEEHINSNEVEWGYS